MPAIVRVKRRIDEEPLNAFVLNGKKRRLDNTPQEEVPVEGAAGGDEISTVLKFAGTINELDNTATTHFARRISKDDAQTLVRTKSARKAVIGNHTQRIREEMRQTFHDNRFRVVNCMRTTLDEGSESESETTAQKDGDDVKSVTIVDIEKQNNETENNMPMQQEQTTPADSDTGYVYDLYLPDDDVQARNVDLMDDNYLSIRAHPEIIFEDIYNDAEDEDDDSEDSNREDYYTNDYPDEDDDQELHSANEYDNDEEEGVRNMCRAVENFVFGNDDDNEDADSEEDVYDDVSSDDDEDYYAYEDPYVQTIDMDNDNFVPDIDTHDVQSTAVSYERYNQLLLKRLRNNDSEDEGDNDEEFEEIQELNSGALNVSSDVELYHSADEQD